MTEPGRETFAELKAAFLALERFVRSHFGYEQEELEEALGYYRRTAVAIHPAPRSGEGGPPAQQEVEGASAAPLAQALHAPSTAQTRGPPPPLRFTTRGRISERVPATRSAPEFCEQSRVG